LRFAFVFNNINSMQDLDTIAQILESHRGDMMNYMMAFTRGDIDLSEELVQAAIVKTWMRSQKTKIDDIGLYLKTCARNMFFDYVRRTQRRATKKADIQQAGLSEFSKAAAANDFLDARLELGETLTDTFTLRPLLRNAILLRMRGYTDSEIATSLGMHRSVIAMRSSRARHELLDMACPSEKMEMTPD
jgi:RNA polymerase sigma factor (sigma-70 family)